VMYARHNMYIACLYFKFCFPFHNFNCIICFLRLSLVDHFVNLAGYEIYLVGGCVRDLILKRTPKDFDIITSAELKEVFSIYIRVLFRCVLC
jgi:hypothetical protein